jgi:DDE domain
MIAAGGAPPGTARSTAVTVSPASTSGAGTDASSGRTRSTAKPAADTITTTRTPARCLPGQDRCTARLPAGRSAAAPPESGSMPPRSRRRRRRRSAYLKVAGKWTYLYRAVDQHGQVIDVLLSVRRDLAAARRFVARAVRAGTVPVEVTTDRAPAIRGSSTSWSRRRCTSSSSTRTTRSKQITDG